VTAITDVGVTSRYHDLIMELLIPWQVLAFWALLTTTSAWAWAPYRWHAAARSTRAGRALPTTFAVVTLAVYISMLV
jgi:hypothetical protein